MRYDRLYSESESLFGERPEKIVEDILRYRSKGRVMEMGAGQGRNSVYLAEHGFNVSAMDISTVGIATIKRLAEEKGLSIDARVGDLRSLEAGENFDIFVCTYVLQHLGREEGPEIIRMIQEKTNAGGLNAISVFTKEGDLYREEPPLDNFYPALGELRELYRGWNILEYEESDTMALGRKADGSPMRNISAMIVAEKI